MKKQFLTKQKGNRGITLIALVITIIVLLILAAISIATLTGENGLLTKANTAKDTTNYKNAEEEVHMEVLGSFDSNGKYNKDIAKDNLNKNLGIPTEDITDNGDGTLTVKYKGYTISVNIGQSQKDEGTPATASAVNELIGQVVAYEDGSGEVTSWRVFYASETEVFLIATNTVASGTAFGSSNGIPLGNYSGVADVFSAKTGNGAGYSYSNVTYGKNYNQLWFNTDTTDTKDRSKATAYLCDPANWTKYIGSNAPSGTYAVGGPTKELFIKSWNASKPQTNVQEVSLVQVDVTTDGYAYNKPDHLYNDDPILKTILPVTVGGEDGLYNNGKSYWLASPSGNYADYVCLVGFGGYVYYGSYDFTGCGVRPLVSIPMSKVQIKEDGILEIGN